MGDEEVQEASWTANITAGISAFLYGVSADQETFMQELNAAVEHIKKSAQEWQIVGRWRVRAHPPAGQLRHLALPLCVAGIHRRDSKRTA